MHALAAGAGIGRAGVEVVAVDRGVLTDARDAGVIRARIAVVAVGGGVLADAAGACIHRAVVTVVAVHGRVLAEAAHARIHGTVIGIIAVDRHKLADAADAGVGCARIEVIADDRHVEADVGEEHIVGTGIFIVAGGGRVDADAAEAGIGRGRIVVVADHRRVLADAAHAGIDGAGVKVRAVDRLIHASDFGVAGVVGAGIIVVAVDRRVLAAGGFKDAGIERTGVAVVAFILLLTGAAVDVNELLLDRLARVRAQVARIAHAVKVLILLLGIRRVDAVVIFIGDAVAVGIGDVADDDGAGGLGAAGAERPVGGVRDRGQPLFLRSRGKGSGVEGHEALHSRVLIKRDGSSCGKRQSRGNVAFVRLAAPGRNLECSGVIKHKYVLRSIEEGVRG